MDAEIILHFPAHAREEFAVAMRRVLGVPVFLRSCLTLAENGFTHFVLLAPEAQRHVILRTWQRFTQDRDLTCTFVACDDRGSCTTAERALLIANTETTCCLLPATTVVSAAWIREQLRPALRYGRPLEGPAAIVTHMQEWNLAAHLTGLDCHPQWYCHITAADEIPRLEHFLCENIRHSANGLVARYLNKRLSLPISRVLARLRTSPNAITAFNMLLGLAAGIGTAGVTYVGLLWGAVLFQLASICDGCDGEVAKLTHRTSAFGQLIDTVSDNFALTSFFVGLTIHHYRVSHSLLVFAWAAALFTAVASILWIMFRFLRQTNSLSLVTFDKEYLQPLTGRRRGLASRFANGMKWILKKEWFSLLFLGMALIGQLPLVLYLVTVAAWVAVATLCWLQRPMPAVRPVAMGLRGTSGMETPESRHG